MSDSTKAAVNSSPSQIQTYLACPRKWWWDKVRKMPDCTDKTPRAMGTVIHGVFERWLRADDLGRNGPDPFQAGWDVARERDGSTYSIDANQRLRVRAIHDAAVRTGVLRRLPGRKVEDSFSVRAADALVWSAIDQWNKDVVEDHKSTATKKYAVSAAKLAEDPKMRCYARKYFETYPDAQTCRLRLNYFTTKEDREPWAVEAVVTRAEIDRFWEDVVVPTCREMVDLRARNLTDDEWMLVEGPREKGICEKYKGCPNAPVCGGSCTPAQLRARARPPIEVKEDHTTVPLIKNNQGTPAPRPSPADAAVPAATAPAAPAAQTPQVAPEATPQVAAPTQTAQVAPVAVRGQNGEVPPWHDKQCQACAKNPGISSKGMPCRPCDAYSARANRLTSAAYEVGRSATGEMTWKLRDGQKAPAAAAVTPAQAPTPAPEQAAPQAEEKPKRTRRPKAEQAPTPEQPPVVVVNNAAPEAPAATQTTGLVSAAPSPREVLDILKPGFVLYLNAIPLRQDYVDLAEVLLAEGRELAEELKVESFYMLDAFKRRDMLSAKVAEVARALEGKNVVSLSPGPELKAYIEALKPLAKMVVVGTFA